MHHFAHLEHGGAAISIAGLHHQGPDDVEQMHALGRHVAAVLRGQRPRVQEERGREPHVIAQELPGAAGNRHS